jgi:hypothetical protein
MGFSLLRTPFIVRAKSRPRQAENFLNSLNFFTKIISGHLLTFALKGGVTSDHARR